MLSYKTVAKASSDEYIVQKSRFIGYAMPCNSESEAQEFIESIRQKHKDATHKCWAYIIGVKSNIMRYSDDGEPSGTAGIPILDTIKNMDITNCVVVVVRYFGGILLGAGGLIRAYRKSALIGIKSASPVIMQSTYRLNIIIDYPLWARFEHKLGNMCIIHEDTSYSQHVELKILVLEKDLQEIEKSINDFCDAIADISHGESFYYPWPISESKMNE